MANIPFAIGQNQETLGLLSQIYPRLSGESPNAPLPYNLSTGEAVVLLGQIRAAYGLSSQTATSFLLQRYVYGANPAPSVSPSASSNPAQAQSDAAKGIIRDAGGNIVYDASSIINETDRTAAIARVQAQAGTTQTGQAVTQQAQTNIGTANVLLQQINMKLSGQMPLSGGETYLSLSSSKGVLERAIAAESKYSGVSPNYGKSEIHEQYLKQESKKKEYELATRKNPELESQYFKKEVKVGGVTLGTTKEYQKAYSLPSIADYRTEARKLDIEYVSRGTGLPYKTVEANWDKFEGKLGKYSYSALLKAGEKEAYQKGSSFVGGLGINLESYKTTETTLDLGNVSKEVKSNEPIMTEYYLNLDEGLSGEEVKSISEMKLSDKDSEVPQGYIKKRWGEVLAVTKQGGLVIDTQTKPFEGVVKQAQPEPEIELFKGNTFQVYYTKEGKTFSTLASEDIFSKMNSLLQSNKQTSTELDRYNKLSVNAGFFGWLYENQQQILNVPREMAIDVSTGLAAKTALIGYNTFGAYGVSLELQWKNAYEGGLSFEEQQVLSRVKEEVKGGTFETLTEPAKYYAFNVGVKYLTSGLTFGKTVIPSPFQAAGDSITKSIGSTNAARLVVSAGGSAAEKSALATGNQYLLGNFAKQVGGTLVTAGIIGSGALAGVEVTADESGGSSVGFNAPRAIGGILTMGAFVVGSKIVTETGALTWENTFGRLGTAENKLPNPFSPNALKNLKEAEARELTGQNTEAEVAKGKLLAKGEANNLIQAQKDAMGEYKTFSKLAQTSNVQEKYGYEYRAARAKAKVEALQTEIAQYVKQPSSVSIQSGMAKERVGLLGQYKMGIQTITRTTTVDSMGRMTNVQTSVKFTPTETGTRYVRLGDLVLNYETNKFFGFEYPTSKPSFFLALPNAPTSKAFVPEMPAPIRAGTTTSGVPIGGGEIEYIGVRLPEKVNIAVAPRVNVINKAQTKTTPKITISPKVETKIAPKIEAKTSTTTRTEIKVKPLAKYAVNYSINEQVRQNVASKSSISEKVGAKESTRERIAERVVVRSIVRERIASRVLVRTRLNTRIKETPRLLPPSFKGITKIQLRQASKGKEKRKRGDERFAYADLLFVSKSQRLYGKGTTPSKATAESRKAIGNYGYRLKTAEQLKYGGKERNNYIFGNRKGVGGLEL